MSFILDALKKSEAERNRNSGPTLLEFRPARPRPRLPWWAVLIAVALLANLAVLAYALLRSPPPATGTVPAVVGGPAAAPAGVAAPVAAPSAPVPAPAVVPPAADSPGPAAADPALAGAATGAGVLPDPALARTPLPLPGIDPDDLPAVAPRSPAATARPPAGSELGLPTMADLAGAGVRLPELRLALHAWDPVPASRYVLLNGSRMREGELTPDGLKVEQITESGVVLEWRGRRFTLRPGE